MSVESNTQKKSLAANFSIDTSRFSFPAEEVKILEFWKEIDAFQRSLELNKGKPIFSFYDGPPFATGLPHYGHLLAGSIKDIVTRYAAQTGHYVERKFGWDCHGLPVEYEIDKKLGITGRDDVMRMGIDKYNKECRSIVMTYCSEWEYMVNRIGRWIDFRNDYKTMHPEFMESVWWVFKQLFDKGQVYCGYKVMPYSTGCCTPLSNFETSQNYKEVTDPAIIVTFPLVTDPSVSLLAWTTTPWTLPSNIALCVHPSFDYVKIKDLKTSKIYILAQSCLGALYKDLSKAEYELLATMKGSELKGLEYVPLFDYYLHLKEKGAFRVLNDEYVEEGSGTGIVHNAPGFGEDDYRVCVSAAIFSEDDRVPCPVDDKGRFTEPVELFRGQYVKDADKEIIRNLKDTHRLVSQSQVTHNYPFCWRSDTPLIYRAIPSWFVRVRNIIPQLLENNRKSYWVPDFVQEKRFHNWLENARDWAISRNRYWGTPIPIWISEDMEEMVCVGSIQELKDLTGKQDITDLHREFVDGLLIPSRKGKGMLRRVEEVLDCWFESGSMPYAQRHYPFENQEIFQASFPADFIGEGLDQTRGWFYTLFVLSTHLFNQPPFKNLIVNGLVLAADGKKMSKRLKNYPEPSLVIDKYGADALRVYLVNSPVVRADPLRFKEEGVNAVLKDVFLPWYNAHAMLIAQIQELEKTSCTKFFHSAKLLETCTSNIMDRWILAATQSLISFIHTEMAAYRLYTVVPQLLNFIELLTNWYVRFNRKRFKGENGSDDTLTALNVFFEVVYSLCRMMAPFTPFLTETMYQGLLPYIQQNGTDVRSIHFIDLPRANPRFFNTEIERAVAAMRTVIEMGRVMRSRRNLSLKTPLRQLTVFCTSEQAKCDLSSLSNYILEELNVKTLNLVTNEGQLGIKYKAIPNLKILGPRLNKAFGAVQAALKNLTADDLRTYLTTQTIEVAGQVLSGDDLQVVRYLDQSTSDVETESSPSFLAVLTCVVDEELKQEGLAREFINRVQKLRKKANLVPSDSVNVVITHSETDTVVSSAISALLISQGESMSRVLKSELSVNVSVSGHLIEEEVEIEEFTFKMALLKLKAE